MSQADFLSGLALSQALPGINVVNLSIWIGYRLLAGPGALVATLGMVLPPLLLAIFMLIGLEQLTGSTLVPQVMAGIAAAAIGLSLEMGVRSARSAATGIGIFVMEWSLIPVILICAPLSVWYAWLQLGDKAVEQS